ncbi:outer membrane protein assembly factor BamB [Chitinibacteraceae bacterium HSL-7]
MRLTRTDLLCRVGGVSMVTLLAACGATSNLPEPSPLPVVEKQLGAHVTWRANAGGKTDFRFLPAEAGNRIVVAGAPADLRALDKASGNELWRVKLPADVAGGVGAGDGMIAVGTIKGQVLAYSYDGQLLWQADAPTEVIAPPLVTDNMVAVRTADGRITGYSTTDGSRKWQYVRQMPSLILRNYAPMVASRGVIVSGLAGGRMVAVRASDGTALWDVPVALPRGATELERVSDVVSAPVISGSTVCAVAYQGRVSCFNGPNGAPLWQREASSAAGVATDGKTVYIVDDAGMVSAHDLASGRSMWRQDKLAARRLSAPVVAGNAVVVADLDGVVHYLSQDDGSLLDQVKTGGKRIAGAPQQFGSTTLVQNQSGAVFALETK